MTVAGLSIPRDGSRCDENEDAMRWRMDGSNLIACVSDGATESVYSRAWATEVADGFVRDAPIDSSSFDLSWRNWQSDFRSRLPRGDQPWYVSNRIEEGSHAALIGVLIRGGLLDALAIGDCCVLHETDGVLKSWPIADADAFDFRPRLLGSEGVTSHVQHARIPVGEGQRVVLASDAAAEWLLCGGVGGLTGGSSIDVLPELVRTARRDRTLRNDDFTLIVIDL